MLVKELDFTAYPHKRICVMDTHGPCYFPEGYDDAVMQKYGSRTLEEEDPAASDEKGDWLTIRVTKS